MTDNVPPPPAIPPVQSVPPPPPPGPSPAPSGPEADARGYLSPEDKRKFTMKAGILGGVFFLAQIVVPIIVMMAAGSVMVFSEILNFERAYARQAASWEGRVYYPASTLGFRRTKPETHLKVLGLEEKARPVIAAPLGSKDCCLLQGTDRLWVIAADAVGSYRDGEVTCEDPGERLGGITRPFLYRGLPAVVEERPNGRVLRTFADGRWQTGVPFDLHLQVQGGTAPEPDPGSLQVVADGGTLHLFLDYHGTLYHREGLPRPDGDAAGAWQTTFGDPTYVYTPGLAARAVRALSAAHAAGVAEDAPERLSAFLRAVVLGPMRRAETWRAGEITEALDADGDGVPRPAGVGGTGAATVFVREVRP